MIFNVILYLFVMFALYVIYVIWRVDKDRKILADTICNYTCPSCHCPVTLDHTRVIMAERMAAFRKRVKEGPRGCYDIWPPDFICSSCKHEFKVNVVKNGKLEFIQRG
jgi:hypothetical protein